MLAIPLMTEKMATKLATAEGIVTHLTSLVLVDEAGERQEGIPANRKVPLSTSRVQGVVLRSLDLPVAPHTPFVSYARREMGDIGSLKNRRHDALSLIGPDEELELSNPFDIASVTHLIDWDADPEALRRGDLSGLPAEVVLAIQYAATKSEIIALADEFGVKPAVVVIALLAKKASDANRSAARIARAILGRSRADAVTAAMADIGL